MTRAQTKSYMASVAAMNSVVTTTTVADRTVSSLSGQTTLRSL